MWTHKRNKFRSWRLEPYFSLYSSVLSTHYDTGTASFVVDEPVKLTLLYRLQVAQQKSQAGGFAKLPLRFGPPRLYLSPSAWPPSLPLPLPPAFWPPA